MDANPAAAIPEVRFSHVGIHVRDIERMERFYTGLLGLRVTDRGVLGEARLVFLSRDAREHHQVVLVSGRPQDAAFSVVNQLSLRVPGLAALRHFKASAPHHGASDLQAVTHGNAISLYLRDPELNRVELFIDTPWYVTQPVRLPIDLERGDAEVWRDLEALCRTLPGYRPAEEWRAGLEARLRGG